MRLIDADMFERVTTKIPDGMDAESYMAGMDYILSKIDEAPTIEPERKRGKWIDRDSFPNYATCSICGFSEEWAYENNYCPNCGSYNGADMRGEA